ncbi:MAG TPA: hypothetical protein VM261_07610 [Kofleriaceae bacterium]|nr:hypothetical protein [Kofleriaceae bacterium]
MLRRILVATALVALSVLAAAPAAAAPQLISFGDAGVKLGDAALFAKPVDGAAFDAAQELLWFRSTGTLYVIDLRDPARAPVAIAKNAGDGAFGIKGLSTASWNATYAGVYPVLSIGKSTKVTTGLGAYGGMWEDQDRDAKKAIKKIKIVGKKWLDKQKKRAPRTAAAAPKLGEFTGKLVTLPGDRDECDGGGIDCGDTLAFGDTAFQLVVVSSSCGDACHLSCVFYDPKTKKFADPGAPKGAWSATIPADSGASCFGEDYGLRAGGEYFMGGKRCTVSSKEVTCTEASGWHHVGWVE